MQECTDKRYFCLVLATIIFFAIQPLYFGFKFTLNYMTKEVYWTNCLPNWHFPLPCLYWEKGVLFVTSKWFYFFFFSFFFFHTNAFRGRVTCLRSLQLTAEFHLFSIHRTQEGVRSRVTVHRSIHWVYGVHGDIHTPAATIVSSSSPLQRPRINYSHWAGYVGNSVDGDGTVLFVKFDFSITLLFFYEIIKVCRTHEFGAHFLNAKQILYLLSTHSYTHTILHNA
jgi:hypothetical protein